MPGFRALLLAVASLAASCAVAPMNAVRDLAAIHDEAWQPRSPAVMTVAPAAYLGGVDLDVARGSGSYEVEDHRGLELAILDRLDNVAHDDPAVALEASAWAILELTEDEHGAARIKAAAILSRLCGAWIEREGARLPAAQDGDPVAATRALDAAAEPRAFLAAMRLLDAAPLPAGPSAPWLVAGAARKAHALGIGRRHESALLLYRLGLRAALAALDEGAAGADAEVAAACRERAALLRRHATRD